MADPKVYSKTPEVLELDPGTYWWCACGRSANQPWCDGSHKGTEFTPVETAIEETKRVAMCNCKHTNNKPFCDGTHTTL